MKTISLLPENGSKLASEFDSILQEAIYRRSVGRRWPFKNELTSTRASCGLFSGTKCPAPLTVTMVNPLCSTNLPPTCTDNKQAASPGYLRSTTEYRRISLNYYNRFVLPKVTTWWFRNQGCHCDSRGRHKASTQYLDPITGTLPSVSPLQC